MPSTRLSRIRTAKGLAVHRAGEGPPLVLLHGVGLRAESWRAQIDALSTRFTVLAPDLPGHGESPRIETADPALADYTGRIAEAVEELARGPVALAGHSMGAMIALDLAIRRPALCRAVAALNAVFRRGEAARRAVRERARDLAVGDAGNLAAAPVARWFGERPAGAAAQAADACRAWLLGADREGYAAAYRVFALQDGPADEDLRALAGPALFLTGSADPNSTPAMSERMARLAPAGRAALVDGAGHMAQMTHPGEVNDALLALITDSRAALA